LEEKYYILYGGYIVWRYIWCLLWLSLILNKYTLCTIVGLNLKT
jgi:hypothetical protein